MSSSKPRFRCLVFVKFNVRLRFDHIFFVVIDTFILIESYKSEYNFQVCIILFKSNTNIIHNIYYLTYFEIIGSLFQRHLKKKYFHIILFPIQIFFLSFFLPPTIWYTIIHVCLLLTRKK